jgi:hypothetical protein
MHSDTFRIYIDARGRGPHLPPAHTIELAIFPVRPICVYVYVFLLSVRMYAICVSVNDLCVCLCTYSCMYFCTHLLVVCMYDLHE